MRAAARRTKGAISSGRWYQLESGYQKAGGHDIPIGTTAATVAAAAKAVDWDVDDALRTAGFDSRDYTPPSESELSRYSDEELLDEIRERMKGARRGVADETESSASPEGDEVEEVLGDEPDGDRASVREMQARVAAQRIAVEKADHRDQHGN